MAKKYPGRTVLVWDHGLFLDALAVPLAKDFGRVLFHVPWQNGYPRSNAPTIGTGIPGIERVLNPWAYYDEIDLWVFPDVYEGDLQEFLAKQGKRVWGCRGGEILEVDRVASKEHSKQLGIDIGNYTAVDGLDALREHLKTHDDQYVKVSAFRGDTETFHAPNYKHAEPQLDELEHNLGAKKKIMQFIVEDAINDAIEVGYDGYVIDGKYAKSAILGVEVKDKAYVGRTMRYERLPERVRDVNAKLAATLKDFDYRGFISTELRLTADGKAYLIDPCCRMGSPPGELYGVWIDNLAEIIWEGAQGIVVEPEYTAKYGAMCLLLSDWADSNWQQVEFPAKYRDNVKLRNFCIIDGSYLVVPQWTGMPEIGAVVAVADTAKAAIEQVRTIAAEVHGHSIEKPCDALDQGLADLKEVSGPEPAPPTRLERDAETLRRRGKISEKAYERLTRKAAGA
jgi:hypothetical protein